MSISAGLTKKSLILLSGTLLGNLFFPSSQRTDPPLAHIIQNITANPRLQARRGIQRLLLGVKSLTLIISTSATPVVIITENAAALSEDIALSDLVRSLGGCQSLLLGIEDLTSFDGASTATTVVTVDTAAFSEDITLSDFVRGLGRIDGLILSVENLAVVVGTGTAPVVVIAEDAAALSEDVALGNFLCCLVWRRAVL